MNKCPNCGARVYSKDRYCQYCRTEVARPRPIEKDQSQITYRSYHYDSSKSEIQSINDTGSIIWGIIGFLFPIIGLLIYMIWHTSKPKNAQKAGLGALIGFIAQVVGLSILPVFSFFRIFRIFP
jgi:uncharacterized membrane protein YvbJ